MIYTFGYILLTALSFVLINYLGINLPKILMVFLSTTYAIVFFHLINYKTILEVYHKIFQIKQAYIVLLVSVFVMWGGSFLIPIYYSPAILVFTFMICTCICGSYFSYLNTKKTSDLIVFILTALILFIFYRTFLFIYPLKTFLIMMLSTALTGGAAYTYFWQSHQLNHLKFKSTEILAIRFWLLFIVSLFIVVKQHDYQLINTKILSETLLLSYFTLILPIYFSQKSIEKIGANLHSVLIALAPFATFLLEKCVLKTKTNIVGYLSIALAIVVFTPWIKTLFYQSKSAEINNN